MQIFHIITRLDLFSLFQRLVVKQMVNVSKTQCFLTSEDP